MRRRAAQGWGVVPWATVVALALLTGSAATASALTTTAGAPLAHVSFPRTSQAVSYGGLTIDVPDAWPVFQREKADCGLAGPGVLVGLPYTGGPVPCPYFPPRGPVITFGGPDSVVPVGHQRSTLVNGIEALVSKSTMQSGLLNEVPQYMTEEAVRFPGETVWLDIRVPGRASARS